MTETAGEQLARLGTDASKWTDEFLEHFYVHPKVGDIPADETARDWQWGSMVAWFASAIESGKSEGYSRAIREDGYR